MDRLVQKIEDGYSLILENPNSEEEAKKQLMDAFKIAIKKLYEYEDAGFSPLQVEGLFADKLNLLTQLETTKYAYETLKEHYDLAMGKLESKQPLSTDYEDEMQCPSCREVVDESDSPIQCVSCKQVLDWSCI